MLSIEDCYLGQEVSCSQCSKNFIVSQPASAVNSSQPPSLSAVYSQPAGNSGPYSQNYYPHQNCDKAVGALVCGIFGLLCCQICSILAIVFGFIAKGEIKNANGRLEGDTMATIGIVLGFLGLAWGVLAIILFMTEAFTEILGSL